MQSNGTRTEKNTNRQQIEQELKKMSSSSVVRRTVWMGKSLEGEKLDTL